MADTCQTKIVKLNNSNYLNWKYKMELPLLKQNLWKKVIVGNRPEPMPISSTDSSSSNLNAITAWDEGDDQARTTIGLMVEDNRLVFIRNKTTAKAAWDALKKIDEKNTLSNIVHLMRTICSLKLEEEGNIVTLVNHLQDLFVKL